MPHKTLAFSPASELTVAEARYPHLPNVRTTPTTRERGNDFHGWTIYIDGGSRVVGGDTFACVVYLF